MAHEIEIMVYNVLHVYYTLKSKNARLKESMYLCSYKLQSCKSERDRKSKFINKKLDEQPITMITGTNTKQG